MLKNMMLTRSDLAVQLSRDACITTTDRLPMLIENVKLRLARGDIVLLGTMFQCLETILSQTSYVKMTPLTVSIRVDSARPLLDSMVTALSDKRQIAAVPSFEVVSIVFSE